MVCPVDSTGVQTMGLWGVFVAILFAISFYLYNWERKTKWYVIVATILLFLALIFLFTKTGWFEICF